MAEQTWGTGYGAKRHLVREGTRQDEPTKKWRRERYAIAECSSTIYLSFFEDGTGEYDGEAVMKKPACPACAKKAGIKPCVRCKGTGQEPS